MQPPSLALAAMLVAAAIGAAACGAKRESPLALPVRLSGASLPPGVHLPRFALHDQDGRVVTDADVRRHVGVVAVLRTRCPECELLVQQVKGALDDLRRPVPVYAIAGDPADDTRARARAFIARVRMGGRMRFLLGSRRAVRPVWRALAVLPLDEPRVLLIGDRGEPRSAFPVSAATPERIAHDLRALGAP